MGRDRWNLNKSQRMQMKGFICLLGILLLAVLLLGKLGSLLIHRGEEEPAAPEPTPYVPVIEVFANVWIMEVDGEGLMIFRDGACESYPWGMAEDGEQRYRAEPSVREQVADIVLTDGEVTSVSAKTEKINGKILGASDSEIEVEGYGRLPLAEDYKGYRLFDSLEMCTVRDLYFGYDFTDLCIEDGQVCGVLMVKEEAMDSIRVLLKTSGFADFFHTQPVLTCDVDYTVIYGSYDGQRQEHHSAWEELSFDYESEYFSGERVRIVPDVLTGRIVLGSCSRAQGIPSYRGQMELLRTEDGIVIINELLLEEYLYSVIPSEMPATYPSEALRAQAVCARTYAYGNMEHAGYPQYGAHVDDSTSYQVYNNIMEQEAATTAAKETYGQMLFTDTGSLARTFYYATSCGVGSDADVWKTEGAVTLTYLKGKSISREAMAEECAAREAGASVTDEALGERLRDEEAFADFISSRNEEDFEADEVWYRWSCQVDALDREQLLETLQQRYAANSRLVLTWKNGEYVSEPIRELDDITDLYIEKRGSGGVADELVIEAGSQKIKVMSENYIRYVLNNGDAKVTRQDGVQAEGLSLLPSGYFVMTVGKEDGNVVGYTLTGGGLGHGVGMSQNAAKKMAEGGYSGEEILLYFYENCAIENVYE